MSASTTPKSSFSQERNNKNPTLKLSLKGQPKSLPNLFKSMNLQDGKPKLYSSQNKAVRSRVKSFEGKKVALDPVLTNIDGLKLNLQTKDSPLLSSLKISNTDEVWAKIEKTQERSNRNPTFKLSLKGQGSLPNLFESLNLQEEKPKPYSQNKVVAR